MQPRVIWEDKYLIVLDKPPGWVVNRVGTAHHQTTVQDWIDQNYSLVPVSSTSDFSLRSGIVHRLDKDTSGLLLIAKTPDVFAHLQAQFKARQVKKTYSCLLHGRLAPSRGEIKLPVGRLPWNRHRFGVLPQGKIAITSYQVKNYYRDKQNRFYSLVSAFPHTGRTHQIRLSFKYLHHPIVSDTFYAGRKTSRTDRVWCPRQFLHASQISFTHPQTKKFATFKSSLPSDLKSALQHLVKADTMKTK